MTVRLDKLVNDERLYEIGSGKTRVVYRQGHYFLQRIKRDHDEHLRQFIDAIHGRYRKR